MSSLVIISLFKLLFLTQKEELVFNVIEMSLPPDLRFFIIHNGLESGKTYL